jgi:putative tryptophan/tyrosine transport system substrate-binding protein
MRRREFVAGLGAAVWPLTARAQRPERMRRIGVLMAYQESDPEGKAPRLYGFTRGLSELGWTDGRNLRLDVRWTGGSVERARIFAKELIALQPDVILANGTLVTAAVQRETLGCGTDN